MYHTPTAPRSAAIPLRCYLRQSHIRAILLTLLGLAHPRLCACIPAPIPALPEGDSPKVNLSRRGRYSSSVMPYALRVWGSAGMHSAPPVVSKRPRSARRRSRSFRAVPAESIRDFTLSGRLEAAGQDAQPIRRLRTCPFLAGRATIILQKNRSYNERNLSGREEWPPLAPRGRAKVNHEAQTHRSPGIGR